MTSLISRRAALCGLASVPAIAAGTAAACAAPASPLRDLIDDYRFRKAEYDSAIDAADTASASGAAPAVQATLDELIDQTYDRLADARLAVFIHQPATADETTERNAVLLEHMRAGYTFDRSQLAEIFGGDELFRSNLGAVAWVRSMRAEGHAFELHGDPADLDAYAVTKRSDAVDASRQMIAAIWARSAEVAA